MTSKTDDRNITAGSGEVKMFTFDCNWQSSLYDPRLKAEVAGFRDFVAKVNAEAQQSRCAVIFNQRAPLTDFHPGFVNFLRKEILFDELCGWLLEVRDLFSQIKRSKAYWLFVGRDDCFGSYFELAQLCDYRLFLDSRAAMGFPAIDANLFPPFGGFESLISRTSLAKKFWKNQQIFSCKEAWNFRLINTIETVKDGDAFVSSWFPGFVAKAKAKVVATNEPDQEDASLPENVDALLESVQRLGLLDQDSPGEALNAWDLGWRLLKAEKSITNPKSGLLTKKKFGWLFAYLATRQILNREFLNRFEALRKYQSRSRLAEAEAPSRRIYIDLNFLVPPEVPMMRLLKCGFNLVFFAEEEQKLAEGLALMTSRMERLGDFPSQKYWRDCVGWYHGHAPHRGHSILHWFSDDVVKIVTSDGIMEMLRFSGNRGRADCGWCELAVKDLMEQQPRAAMEIAEIISDGIIKAKKIAGGQVRLSMFVRSMFLEELYRLGHVVPGGSSRILTELRTAGWGYIADEGFWQFFLRSRRESYLVSADKVTVGGMGVSEGQWNLGVWKELREIITTVKSEVDNWNTIAISRHFAIYVGLLQRAIETEKLIANSDLADVFVGACLGFPRKLGSPLMFMQHLGSLRVEHYVQRHWQRNATSRTKLNEAEEIRPL